jgi:hypothetical protein
MDRRQIRIQIKHPPQPRDDLGYGGGVWKIQRQLKRIHRRRLDRKRAVNTVQRDAARVKAIARADKKPSIAGQS